MKNKQPIYFHEVVEKLIGEINPVGSTDIDSERLENLKQMCDLVAYLLTEIENVAINNRHSHEYSIKEAVKYVDKFMIEQLGLRNDNGYTE